MLRKLSEVQIVAIAMLVCIGLLFAFSSKGYVYSTSDGEGYYMYLPALTIYDGFKDIPILTPQQFHLVDSTGNYYNKYTAGIALMQLPYYMVAYAGTGLSTKYEQDGYSSPFQWSILLSALSYTFLGMFFLYQMLREKYSIVISIVVLICLFYGTNLFFYSYYDASRPHAYGFFLWVALIWQTRKIYSLPSWRNFALMSVIISLLVFIRPSNAIGALFILMWGAESIRTRLGFISRHFLKNALLIVPFIILTLIQLSFWKEMLGSTVFFSYNSEPGFIYWATPKIGNVLFHVHNGLFIYAPILIFAIIGLVLGIRKREKYFPLFAFILALATYIFASWWCWWFGGAYGSRSYVELLPLMSFPLAYFICQVVRTNKKWLTVSTGIVGIVFVVYSMLMTAAYTSPWDGPNFGWLEYWAIVKGLI